LMVWLKLWGLMVWFKLCGLMDWFGLWCCMFTIYYLKICLSLVFWSNHFDFKYFIKRFWMHNSPYYYCV
jgi:hypothetical protein